jgi:hypothetical protein
MAARPVEFVLRLLGVKEATGQLSGLAGAADKTQTATARAGDGAAKAGNRLRELGDRAGDGESSLLALSGVLDMISPALGDLARRTGDIAGATEGAVKGYERGLIPALGVATIAIGAAWLAWQTYAEAGERAAKIDSILAENQQRLRPLLEATADAQLELAVARGEITEEEAQAIQARTDAYRGYTDAVSGAVAQLKTLREEEGSFISGLGTRLSDALQSFTEGPTGTVVDNIPIVAAARGMTAIWGGLIDGVTTSSAEFEAERAALEEGIAGTAAAAAKLIDLKEGLISTAAASSAAEVAGVTSGEGKLLVAVDPRSLEILPEVFNDGFRGLTATLQFEADPVSVDEFTKTLGRKLGPLMSLMSGDLGGAIEGGLANLASGTGALSGIAGTALGALGPAGAAAGALSMLGTAGAGGVADSIESSVEAILDGIVELPELLLIRLPELIPRLIVGIAEAFLVSLPKAILEAWAQIWQSIVDLFTRTDEEKEQAEGRRAARRARIADVLALGETLGGRASGGLIAETGRYMLHQGELVVPASGVTSSSGASQLSRALGGGMGGGGVTVVNQGLMTRSLAQEVARMIRHGQSGYGESLSLDPVI